MSLILIVAISLGIIALALAVILYVASKKFAAYENPRIAQIFEALSQTNCGGRGYPGCSGFVDVRVKADSPEGKFCLVGGQPVISQVALILGLDTGTAEPMVAVVRCNGTCTSRLHANIYDGIKSCAVAVSLYDGGTGCSYGCPGCDDRVATCQFDATHMNPETGLPEVDEEKCAACGARVKACSKAITELHARGKRSRRVYVSCVNKDKGTVVHETYATSCTGCGKCIKTCPSEAVTPKNSLAYIDYNKCKFRRKRVEAYPQNTVIELSFPPRKPREETPVTGAVKAAEV